MHRGKHLRSHFKDTILFNNLLFRACWLCNRLDAVNVYPTMIQAIENPFWLGYKVEFLRKVIT